ncbi:MAG: response regulator [FCB group bacterium]|nr:response regulator [FCB group bacterium]
MLSYRPIIDSADEKDHCVSCEISDFKAPAESKNETDDAMEMLRSLIDQSEDAMYLFREGRFEMVNSKLMEIFSVTLEEMLSADFDYMDLIAPQSRELILERNILLNKGEDIPGRYEFVGISKGKKEIHLEASVSYVQYKGHLSTVGIIRDLTSRRKLEAEFQQAQKMEAVGRLAGGVAHDFNNLLTVIGGNASLASIALDKNHPVHEELNEINLTVNRASDLTRQLLAFSRKQEIKPQILDLNDSLINMEKMMYRLIGEHIELRLIKNSELSKIFADPSQIQQIVINLVVNARDAMPQGGLLLLETRVIEIRAGLDSLFPECEAGEYVQMKVSDTGQGMCEEVRAHIFEPFYTTKPKDKGTGLGLSTVYGIVMQNSGQIKCESTEGKGAAFEIYFPAASSKSVNQSAEKMVSEPVEGNETILIVEDEISVREMAVRTLEHYGYDVLEASDPYEAMSIFESLDKPVHLIVTDVIMPHQNGPELIRQLSEMGIDSKALYMSGYNDEMIVGEGVMNSEIDYLSKPFSPYTLASTVRKILDGNNEMQEENVQ